MATGLDTITIIRVNTFIPLIFWVLILALFSFGLGHYFGSQKGKEEGVVQARATIHLELKEETLTESECPVCHTKFSSSLDNLSYNDG